MQRGSPRARVLKLADCISNLTALGFVHDAAFVTDTRRNPALRPASCRRVNPDMFRELSDLVDNRGQRLWQASGDATLTPVRFGLKRCKPEVARDNDPAAVGTKLGGSLRNPRERRPALFELSRELRSGKLCVLHEHADLT